MDRCDICTTWLFELEGFDSDDPADRGGATRLGISLALLKTLPAGQGDLDRDGDVDRDDVQRVTEAYAREIYRTQFWNACSCDRLPQGWDAAVFSVAVNCGAMFARRALQEALRVPIDGNLGPQTIAAVQATGLGTGLPWFLARTAQHYADIIRADRSQAKWELGWYRRLFLTQQFALKP